MMRFERKISGIAFTYIQIPFLYRVKSAWFVKQLVIYCRMSEFDLRMDQPENKHILSDLNWGLPSAIHSGSWIPQRGISEWHESFVFPRRFNYFKEFFLPILIDYNVKTLLDNDLHIQEPNFLPTSKFGSLVL